MRATMRELEQVDGMRAGRGVAWLVLLAGLLITRAAEGEVRVQDVARLQGQRTNQLMGYGLVVGLNGTGDGGKSLTTIRALMQMHKRYAQEVISPEWLKSVGSVALVSVEATIPEFGGRDGQTMDVIVATVGEAKSLKGGRLLTTPLQYAMFDPARPETQQIFALASGAIELVDAETPTVGRVRGGAVLEADFYYNFIEGGAVTLVINDNEAGYPMAHAIARAINQELARPTRNSEGRIVVQSDIALAYSPKFVRVEIPPYELSRPASFITRVLEAEVFKMPEPPARVTINRRDHQISFTGDVTISPTTIYVPGLGSVSIGQAGSADVGTPAPPDPAGAPVAAPGGQAALPRTVPFAEFLRTLSLVNVPPEQVVKAVEHLHQSGALHGQLLYRD